MEEEPGGKNTAKISNMEEGQGDQAGLPPGSQVQSRIHDKGEQKLVQEFTDNRSKTSREAEVAEYLLQDNFSYMELLCGQIDLTKLYGNNANVLDQVRTSSSIDNGNARLSTPNQTVEVIGRDNQPRHDSNRLEIQGSKSSHGVFPSNNAYPSSSSTFTTGNGEFFQESNNGHTHIQENPWDSNMFQDIELDELEKDKDKSYESEYEQDFDHTWNLDQNNGSFGEDVSANQNSSESPSADQGTGGNDISEKDVDNFIENEKDAAEREKKGVSAELKPEKGMQFKSREEAQQFLNMYSFAAGFSIAVVSVYRTQSKKRNNEVTRATIKCNKHGHNSETESEQVVQQRQGTVFVRTDCKVEFVISEKQGLWSITNLMLDHNHPLDPGSRYFRSHVYMTKEEKAIIRTMKQCNIPTRNIVSVLAHLRGGMEQLPYNKRKVCNYGTSINRELKNSDLMEVQDWFNKKQAEDPGFYYSMELDQNNKVRSVFWSDARSRLYYDLYGDCISFDTTFLTNKYNLPFAPIVGISPHGKTYLFGCALIVNETAKTFEWVFRQLLICMRGKHPVSIITDQDKAMENAIKLVFPNATHRNCLFHVKKKCDDKNGSTFAANEGLYEDMQDIIDNSLTENEFETLWQAMIEEHKVGGVKFFDDMWKNRKKYVLVYFKTKFFPFIQTTARREGTNSLFKKGVGAKFSMTSFLREYQRIIDTIHAREDECDHNVAHKTVPTKQFATKYYIERQAHELYNLEIFRKFQYNLKDVTRLCIREQVKNEIYVLFQASNYAVKEHRTRNYIVQVNLAEEEYSCICCKFEKDGILCPHILKVMLHLEVGKIPDKYIIERWRKKQKKLNYNTLLPQEVDNDCLRYNLLSRRLVQTASKGSKSREKGQYLLQEILKIEEHLDAMDRVTEETAETETTAERTSTRTVSNMYNTSLQEGTSSTIEMLDPDVVNTKGRPRMLTIKEKIKQNKFYKCGHCGSGKHTKKNCPSKDIEFNLPKTKRTRKPKVKAAGTVSPAKKPSKRGKKSQDPIAAAQDHQLENKQNQTCEATSTSNIEQS